MRRVFLQKTPFLWDKLSCRNNVAMGGRGKDWLGQAGGLLAWIGVREKEVHDATCDEQEVSAQ